MSRKTITLPHIAVLYALTEHSLADDELVEKARSRDAVGRAIELAERGLVYYKLRHNGLPGLWYITDKGLREYKSVTQAKN